MWSFSVACPLLYSLLLKKGPLTKDKFVNKIRIKITVDEMKSEIHENQQWWNILQVLQKKETIFYKKNRLLMIPGEKLRTFLVIQEQLI